MLPVVGHQCQCLMPVITPPISLSPMSAPNAHPTTPTVSYVSCQWPPHHCRCLLCIMPMTTPPLGHCLLCIMPMPIPPISLYPLSSDSGNPPLSLSPLSAASDHPPLPLLYDSAHPPMSLSHVIAHPTTLTTFLQVMWHTSRQTKSNTIKPETNNTNTHSDITHNDTTSHTSCVHGY